MPEPPIPIPPLIAAAEAAELLAAIDAGREEVEISLDLGQTMETVRLGSGGASLRGVSVTRDELVTVTERPTAVFAAVPGGPRPLEVRRGGYAKLVPTGGAPTVELSGVRMHRTAGIDPFEDARTKAAAVVVAGDRVLDTCGGLGYTATWERRLGAKKVISVEIDPAVLELRLWNPWSREFLEDCATERLEGDVAELICGFPEAAFDCVLHDPPRFSLAGELYGSGFTGQLQRVLRLGGRLLFYTGEPYRRGRGRDFVAGVARRLTEAGFKAEWRRELYSFVANR